MNANRRDYSAGVVGGSFIYLYVNLFALPAIPFLLGGDQVQFWMHAQRLLHGELLYRDFLEFTPPGTDLIYLGAFELLGTKIWVTNLMVLLLGVSLGWLCFYIARSIMTPALALLTTALFLVLDYGKMLNGTHHWFSVLAVMGAAAVLIKTRTPVRIALAGALLGIATFFTQTRGPAAALGIAAYLLLDRRHTQEPFARQLLLLFLPLVTTWAALSSFFVARIGLGELWYFQVTYLLRYVSKGPSDSDLHFLVVDVSVLVVYALSLWKSLRTPRDERILLLTLVGLAMFIEVSGSPNWIRLYCVALPALILVVRLLPVQGAATALVWIGLACIASHQTWVRHREQSMIVDLPAGTAATLPPVGGKLAWLAQHTRPGQSLFEARWVDVYLPLALRHPVFTDMLEGGHDSRPEFVTRSIQQLEAQRVQYIIWAPRLELPPYPFPQFHRFLLEHYEWVLTFPDQDQVWQRK